MNLRNEYILQTYESFRVLGLLERIHGSWMYFGI